MADISITERFGAEPLHCDCCGAEHPHHTPYCKRYSPEEVWEAREHQCRDQLRTASDRAARAERSLAHCQTALKVAERERDEARQAADEWAEAKTAALHARDTAQRDACLRGFAIVRAAFEAWRDGDKVTRSVGHDTDVFLALQATYLGFQALTRALEKGERDG